MKKKSTIWQSQGGPSYIHFIGIGGIGMSALARYFLNTRIEADLNAPACRQAGIDAESSLKARISGSDAAKSEIADELVKEGVKVKIGHKMAHITPKLGLVIHSAAIPSDNPEIKKAKKLGIPIKSYSEVIGELTKKHKTIAVSGSHGKSTTTAILSLVLVSTRFDPTVIMGTKLKEFGNQHKSALSGNFRKGKSDYLVLEADEYQKSFLRYFPIAAIITNIDREHLDVYKNLNNVKKVFLKFIKNIRPNGILVVNKDDKNLFGLKNKIQKITKQNKLKTYWYTLNKIRNLRYSHIFADLHRVLKIPGNHNLSNALAVYTMARALGVSQKKIFSAMSKYRGAWRRMEFRGRLKIKDLKFKIEIYDDYAHHPTEIKATLAAFRQKYPESKIICVFQPHQAERLRRLFKDFVSAFDEADILILLDIYKVAGRDLSSADLRGLNADKRGNLINSRKLAETIQKRKTSPSVFHLKNHKNLMKFLKETVCENQRKSAFGLRKFSFSPRQSAIVVMMGAGDIYKHTIKLLQ